MGDLGGFFRMDKWIAFQEGEIDLWVEIIKLMLKISCKIQINNYFILNDLFGVSDG